MLEFQFLFDIPNDESYLNIKVQFRVLENYVRVITLT